MKKLSLAVGLAWVLPLLSPTISGNVAVAQQNALWVDVRTQAEWEKGHLDEAILLPYDRIARNISSVVKHKSQPIKLYCQSGRRAEIALRTLEQLGYTNVQNLGGYHALKAQGH